jgi:hypothetical protein
MTRNVFWGHDDAVGAIIRHGRSTHSRLAGSIRPAFFATQRFLLVVFFSVTIRNFVNPVLTI